MPKLRTPIGPMTAGDRGQPEFRLPSAVVSLCHACGQEVDESAADEKRDHSADEACQGEKADVADFPFVWFCEEYTACCHLEYDVPVVARLVI